MGDAAHLGKSLIGIGLLAAALGVLLLFSEKMPWPGRLPGDLVFKRENLTVYFPLATSIILSLALTLLFWFLGKK